MSEMEYNKGKLIPTDYDYQDLFDELSGDYDQLSERYTVKEWCRDNLFDSGYEILNNKIYRVVYEIECGELYHLCNVQKLPDGSMTFETYHYNGGGHWIELVEKKL